MTDHRKAANLVLLAGGGGGASTPRRTPASTTSTASSSSSSASTTTSCSFPLALGALLLLSLALTGGLLYASISVVVVVPRYYNHHHDRSHHHHNQQDHRDSIDAYHTYSFLLSRPARRRDDPEEEGDSLYDDDDDSGDDNDSARAGADRKEAENDNDDDDDDDDDVARRGVGDPVDPRSDATARSYTVLRGGGRKNSENTKRSGTRTDPSKGIASATTQKGTMTASSSSSNGARKSTKTSAAAAPAPAARHPTLPTTPYAYAFLLVGCDLTNPHGYRPLLSSILVALHLLRKYGSTQDAIVYVMMAPTSSPSTTNTTVPAATTTLPIEELRVLGELNAMVRQVPSMSQPTFHRIMLQKFRVLGLTQYRRVMFLDCDVMPLRNLDELFTLSDPIVTNPPVLQENLIFLDYVSPANGGTFMLAPHEGDLQHVNDMIREAQLIRNQGVEGKEPWRLFPPDQWEGFEKGGKEYDFHAVSGDQGLLWSWVRHYQRRFSYVVKDGSIHNFVPDDDNDHGNSTTNAGSSTNNGIRLESVIAKPFLPHHDEVWPLELTVWGTKRDAMKRLRANPPKPGKPIMPHQDHLGAFGYLFHFLLAGGGKPWYNQGCVERWDVTRMPANASGIEHAERARRFWCQTYHQVAIRHNLSTSAASLSGVNKYVATSHHTIGSEMWATPGPVTNLLEPDFDPWSLHDASAASATATSSS